VFELEEGYDVVLDQTMFYPEGGGQPADRGQLTAGETTVDVVDVQERNGVVLHRTDADPGRESSSAGRSTATAVTGSARTTPRPT